MPAAVRHALGLTPGAVIEWTQKGDTMFSRSERSSTGDTHEALFSNQKAGAPPKTRVELKQGVRHRMQRRHARG